MDKDCIIKVLGEYVNWNNLSKSGNLSEEFIMEYIDKINLKILFEHQVFSEDFLDTLVSEYANKIDWRIISKGQNLSEDFIREYEDLVDWTTISKYQKLSNSFINEFNYKVNWKNISAFQNISLKLAMKYKSKIDWFNACFNEYISEEILSIGRDEIFPYFEGNIYLYPRDIYQSNIGSLSITALRLFKDDLNWENVCYHNRNLSDDVIREFHNEVDWKVISRYHDLSEDFIREFKDYVSWEDISTYQILTKEFIKEFRDKLAA